MLHIKCIIIYINFFDIILIAVIDYLINQFLIGIECKEIIKLQLKR
jgi:hypothetical protein